MLKITREHPAIVIRAYMKGGVIDIGQLSKEELKELKKAVKEKVLDVITDYTFPAPKKRYVMNFEDWKIIVKDEQALDFMYKDSGIIE